MAFISGFTASARSRAAVQQLDGRHLPRRDQPGKPETVVLHVVARVHPDLLVPAPVRHPGITSVAGLPGAPLVAVVDLRRVIHTPTRL